MLCAGVAFLVSMLFRDYAVKSAVPVVFLVALVPVAYLSGRMASLVVAMVASWIFAVYLLSPTEALPFAAWPTESICCALDSPQ
jgi:K+-sensing histidine kinase KdpD